MPDKLKYSDLNSPVFFIITAVEFFVYMMQSDLN